MLSYERGKIDYTDADAYIAQLKQHLKKRTKFEEEITNWALDALEVNDDIIEAEANIPNEDQKVKELLGLIEDGTDRKFDTLVRAVEQKLLEIAKTIGKVDNLTGEVTEDFRSEVLGYLGSSLNYNELYKEALLNRDYDRTEQEIIEAIKQAKEASNALRQLTQDLTAFNLENYIKLKGKYTLDDLRVFCEKAIISLGGSFIPSGEIISIVVPPVVKKYPGDSSMYENAT